MSKPILCVDFDGVLHSYTSGWQGASVVSDPPVPGAFEFLERAVAKFDVCIYSSRSRQWGGKRAMKRWLRKYASSELVNQLRFPTKKPAAFLTIDDRAICFNGYFPSIEFLLAFKPWTKQEV